MSKFLIPIWVSIISLLIAQFLKPFFYYFKNRVWDWDLILSSGGFPSSHSAIVAALSVYIGLQERFSSPLFAVTVSFSIIVIYDAANVRFYSGENIRITQQLLKDLQENKVIDLSQPIYKTKFKEALGHKWHEVIGGILLGGLLGYFFFFLVR